VELKGEAVDEDGNAQFPGGLFAQIDFRTGAEGTGGNLTIETKRLSVSDGSRIQVATFGQGEAGDLIIRASEVNVFNTGSPRFFTAIDAGVLQDPNSEIIPRGNGEN
jgi:large exoprotein involved in heme utilization and adhesion